MFTKSSTKWHSSSTKWHSSIIDNCPELANNNETEYQDLFGSIKLQVKAVKLFMAIFKTKQGIEEEDEKEDS